MLLDRDDERLQLVEQLGTARLGEARADPDVLELVVNIEKTLGVQIPDRETGAKVLLSVNSIVDYLKASGTTS